MTINTFPLPAGYTVRSGHIDDYQITCDLLNIFSLHLNGKVDLNDPEILRADWENKALSE